MPNANLDEFVAGGDQQRPAAEAAAIAGDGSGSIDFVDTTDYRFPDADGAVELAVTQVDYTVAGRGPDERPILHVFGRDADREVEHVRVHGFRPYFYAPLAEFEGVDDPDRPVAATDLTDPRLDADGLTGVETYADRRADGADVAPDRDDDRVVAYESIRGRRLLKVFGRTPRDVGQARDEFDHYEADILFPNRLLIDKDIRSGVRVPDRRADDGAVDVPHQEVEPVGMDVAPRVNTFDIEVDDRSGFPEDGEEAIVCLSAHDSYRDEYVVWLSEPPSGAAVPGGLDDHEPLDPDVTHEVRSFASERAMLADFLDYIDATDPDVLTGWNFTDFDAPYFLDRLEELGGEDEIDPDRLSRVEEVWRSDWQGPNVKGRVAFDLLYAYQRTQFTELDSYRLDDVGEEELGVGKERYPGDIGDLWEDDPERLLEYNLRDVELCVELDRKQEIVAFWNDARKLVGCKIEDAPTPGDAVDMYVLHKAHGRFVLPSKGQQESEEFEGGAVFEPISGVREMLSVLDLKSLYPMSMVTINASPETIVDPETHDGETYRTPSGIHFRKDRDGIIREMVDALLDEREQLKARRDDARPGSTDYERYDRQQSAVKVIMNSLYGVFGWDRFRLYDREMSAAITATNREVIAYTEEVANGMDYEVTYGDTDSVMLQIGDGLANDEAIDRAFELAERINRSYDEFARERLNADSHRFEIEFEKLYRRFFQAGKKKRYAGHVVWKEGDDVDDIDIVGFEYQRSDIAPITKEVQREVLERIVRSEGEYREAVKEYVHDVIERFQNGEMSVEEVGVPGGIGKRLDNYDTNTAQVRGAKYANLLLGTNFGRGSKPKRLYLKRVHNDFYERVETERGLDIQEDSLYREFRENEDVVCVEYADQLPEEFEVDWEKMLDRTLRGPIERVLSAIDISWEEVKTGQEQTGLSSFM